MKAEPLRRVPGLWFTRALLVAVLVVNNIIGVVVVFVLLTFVVPLPSVEDQDALRHENLVLTAIYLVLGLVVGLVRGSQVTRRISSWLRSGHDPGDPERLAVLRAPARIFGLQGVLWGLGAVFFGLWNARYSAELGALVTVIVSLAGLTTCAFAYLISERVLRPVARLALAKGIPRRRIGMQMGARTFLAWLLSSGIGTFGVMLAGLTALNLDEPVTAHRLAITMVVLGGIAFWIGGSFTLLAAHAASDPVRALRAAVDRVGAGDLTAEVPIYDGTELGVLQAGFNDMVHGLRERETIRDLFGRHVGDDVAHAALERGVQLGGEVREVAVLFVDIIGSTSMATDRPPGEVVRLLNRFFDVVIEVVHECGGWINKFEGDAALAVWGAPVALPDKEQAVLRAARLLGERLREDVPELEAGVGASAGPAVAGNVGAAQRYEYTVIGDPVNEAARLTELAKSVPGMVVANARLLEHAGPETGRWVELDPVVVRGRSEPTRVARPR